MTLRDGSSDEGNAVGAREIRVRQGARSIFPVEREGTRGKEPKRYGAIQPRLLAVKVGRDQIHSTLDVELDLDLHEAFVELSLDRALRDVPGCGATTSCLR